jgi:hypothetical protein
MQGQHKIGNDVKRIPSDKWLDEELWSKVKLRLPIATLDIIFERDGNVLYGYRREFEIHLIESTSGALPLPKLNLDVRLVLNKAPFKGVLTDFWQPALPSPHPTTWSEPHRMQIGLLPGHPGDLSVLSTLSHSWGRVEEKVTVP